MKHLLPALILVSVSHVALAQVNPNQEEANRLDRLEKDLQLIQKQIAIGGDVPMSPEEAKQAATVGNARLGVQLSQIQDELRKIRGQQEQTDFAIKRVQEAQERMQKDVDLRLSDVEKRNPTPAPTPEAAVAPVPVVAEAQPAPTPTPATPAPVPSGKADLSKAVIKVENAPATPAAAPAAKDAPKTFDQPRDQYNYAFRLLNQTRYDEAAEYFQSFVQKFPKDPLIGNAYYWLGETFYIKRDYVKAADHFRQGFEALPSGPKAADNLLKLAMALSALKRNTDACTVLEQLTTKFTSSSSVLLKKAEEEKVRIGCS